jgi:tRNA A-37 threonylcarbamoyl transferase component Bud32
VIFTLDALRGIADGRITLAFRRWASPRVKVGSRQRNAMGVIEFVSVEPVDEISDEDARAAGFADAAAALAAIDKKSRGGSLYRIGVRYLGADPRHALRERADLAPDELAVLRERLRRMDRGDAWTESYLRLIAANPGVVARELAPQVGTERDPFKIRVRRLKDLGLTESLEVGYRISPRGAALLAAIGDSLPDDAELIGEGRMAQVFALDAGTVVKLDRPEFNGVAAHEAAILRNLARAEVPVPEVIRTAVFDGREGIVMERLHGPPLAELIRVGGDTRQLAQEFVELHLALHSSIPAGAPELVPWLVAAVELSGLPSATTDELLRWLSRADGEVGLCHFDLHPDNIIVTESGWRVIDWIAAAVGPPTADFARTLLLRADAADRRTAEFMRFVRTIGAQRRSVADAELGMWLRTVAAARLCEGFTGDYADWLRAVAIGDATVM